MELILNPENEELLLQMQEICEYFMEINRPQNFNPRARNNVLVDHDKSFENISASMQEAGFDPCSLTVFEFYARIEHFESKYEKIKSHGPNKPV